MPSENQRELLEATQNNLDFFEKNYINVSKNSSIADSSANSSANSSVNSSVNSSEKTENNSTSIAELKASQIVNRKPDRIENQTDLSYLTSCQNMVAYGGYNRKARRELKRRAKAKSMEDANFIASIVRQQTDKAQEEKNNKNGNGNSNNNGIEVVGINFDEEKVKEQEALGNM